MHDLIERFADDEKHNTRNTFTMLARVFNEQCEVIEDAIEIRKHPGGDVIQNTSDPDATRDGKKGPGYQVQLAETCDADNDVQLITAAIPRDGGGEVRCVCAPCCLSSPSSQGR